MKPLHGVTYQKVVTPTDFGTSFGIWREKVSLYLDDVDKVAKRKWSNNPHYRDNLWYEFSVEWGRIVKRVGDDEVFSIL